MPILEAGNSVFVKGQQITVRVDLLQEYSQENGQDSQESPIIMKILIVEDIAEKMNNV